MCVCLIFDIWKTVENPTKKVKQRFILLYAVLIPLPFIAILNLFGTKYDEQILFISFTKKQIIFKHLKHKRYLLLCSFRITTIYMYIIHFCTLSTLILGVYVFYHYVWYFYYSPDGVIWYFFFLIWIWDQCRSVLM